MKKFDDREKKHDRDVNKLYLHYRKFLSKETCPTCNIGQPLKDMLEVSYDRKKKRIIHTKWIHSEEECYRWHLSVIFALRKSRSKTGRIMSEKSIDKILTFSLRKLRRIDRKFTERGE